MKKVAGRAPGSAKFWKSDDICDYVIGIVCQTKHHFFFLSLKFSQKMSLRLFQPLFRFFDFFSSTKNIFFSEVDIELDDFCWP